MSEPSSLEGVVGSLAAGTTLGELVTAVGGLAGATASFALPDWLARAHVQGQAEAVDGGVEADVRVETAGSALRFEGVGDLAGGVAGVEISGEVAIDELLALVTGEARSRTGWCTTVGGTVAGMPGTLNVMATADGPLRDNGDIVADALHVVALVGDGVVHWTVSFLIGSDRLAIEGAGAEYRATATGPSATNLAERLGCEVVTAP